MYIIYNPLRIRDHYKHKYKPNIKTRDERPMEGLERGNEVNS
jgi:hypothetical protein